jgi:hypothetical protein
MFELVSHQGETTLSLSPTRLSQPDSLKEPAGISGTEITYIDSLMNLSGLTAAKIHYISLVS